MSKKMMPKKNVKKLGEKMNDYVIKNLETSIIDFGDDGISVLIPAQEITIPKAKWDKWFDKLSIEQ